MSIHVTGIGGLFFRATDPAALAAWYHEHLGISPYTEGLWQQEGGPTVFMPFAHDTDHFPPGRQYMLNLRVADMESAIAHCQAAGIAVITNPEWDTEETGKFARINDPDGNPIELWQPPAEP